MRNSHKPLNSFLTKSFSNVYKHLYVKGIPLFLFLFILVWKIQIHFNSKSTSDHLEVDWSPAAALVLVQKRRRVGGGGGSPIAE